MVCPWTSLRSTQGPEKTEVELQKDVVGRHWKSYIIRDALWHVCDAWKEVMESFIRGAWKKLCPGLAVNFRGFDPFERLSEERLKCLELARKVGLDKIEEEDVNSLLESIGEELDELEKQWRQLEEEVEADQHPTAPSTKQLTGKILQHFLGIMNQGLDYLEEADRYYERAGLTRRRVMANLAHYEQLLYEKRREAMQATFNVFFRKASLPEASASDEPHTSNEPPARNESQPGISTGGFTCNNVPSLSPDVNDPGVV